jgi:hypothetical protein
MPANNAPFVRIPFNFSIRPAIIFLGLCAAMGCELAALDLLRASGFFDPYLFYFILFHSIFFPSSFSSLSFHPHFSKLSALFSGR